MRLSSFWLLSRLTNLICKPSPRRIQCCSAGFWRVHEIVEASKPLHEFSLIFRHGKLSGKTSAANIKIRAFPPFFFLFSFFLLCITTPLGWETFRRVVQTSPRSWQNNCIYIPFLLTILYDHPLGFKSNCNISTGNISSDSGLPLLLQYICWILRSFEFDWPQHCRLNSISRISPTPLVPKSQGYENSPMVLGNRIDVYPGLLKTARQLRLESLKAGSPTGSSLFPGHPTPNMTIRYYRTLHLQPRPSSTPRVLSQFSSTRCILH